MGLFMSARKAAQKRRREREKSETEYTQRSTDSGIGSEEERESNNELDAPRETTADNQPQNHQSTATDVFSNRTFFKHKVCPRFSDFHYL